MPLKDVEDHIKKPLPKHINWLFSLGSMAAFLLILQAVTGAFLAFYYSPSPDHAYNAVKYISGEVLFGGFVRGLHHWGASAMVIVVFLHLLRVVVYASYKPPREMTWVTGVLMFLIVLGFGFTGYLLPWDQKAYWATVVGVKIAGTAPVIGEFVAKVLRGGEEVGAVTLTRFYALHTIWLPWLAFGLIAVHLFFVRYYGSAGTAKNSPEDMRSGKPFYPDQLFEDAIAILILFVILAAMASLFLCRSKSLPIRPMLATIRARSGIFCFCSSCSSILRDRLRWLARLLFLRLGLSYSFSFPFWIGKRSGLRC